jgi:hypothetical protein
MKDGLSPVCKRYITTIFPITSLPGHVILTRYSSPKPTSRPKPNAQPAPSVKPSNPASLMPAQLSIALLKANHHRHLNANPRKKTFGTRLEMRQRDRQRINRTFGMSFQVWASRGWARGRRRRLVGLGRVRLRRTLAEGRRRRTGSGGIGRFIDRLERKRDCVYVCMDGGGQAQEFRS